MANERLSTDYDPLNIGTFMSTEATKTVNRLRRICYFDVYGNTLFAAGLDFCCNRGLAIIISSNSAFAPG